MQNHPLEACPFCGASAKLGHNVTERDLVGSMYVSCTAHDCGATITNYNSSTEELVKAWNRREGVKHGQGS